MPATPTDDAPRWWLEAEPHERGDFHNHDDEPPEVDQRVDEPEIDNGA